MKIYNKFVESKKEPSNKNDIWFDGSVVRLYEAGEWYTVTLSKEALEKLVKYAENVKIFKYVDTLPEIGDPSLIYFQKELSDGGIILVPYVYDGEWKQITNSEVFTETSPFGFGDAENSAVLKGGNNKVTNANEVALGEYNESNNDTRFSIGIGTSDTDRKNAIEVKENGDVYITGIGGYNDDNFNKAKTLKSVIDNKIDKVEGKDLSSNDFTNTLKEKLESLKNYDDAEISSAVEKLSRDFNALLGNNASAAIESFNEIIAFLEGIEDSASLDAIVASIQQEIAKVSNGLADTDTKLTNLSERVEENEVLIEGLRNTKIDKEADDYYPNMSVGLADNLAGVDEVDSEIAFRRSGGGAISDGVARIEAIKGNSVVWNQKLPKKVGWIATGDSSYVYDDVADEYTITSGKWLNRIETPTNITKGHKYIVCYDVKVNTSSSYEGTYYIGYIGSPTQWFNKVDISNAINKWYRHIEIFTVSADQSRIFLGLYDVIPLDSQDTQSIRHPRLIDLTLMFGAGNEPTTIEEFNARKPLGIDENAYNEGEVIHMDAQSLESVGVNQWDEEWRNGYYVGKGVFVPYDTQVCNTNPIEVLPNEQYYINFQPAFIWYYDADMGYLSNSYVGAQRVFTIPSNAKYINVGLEPQYGSTYNHDICINIYDTSINGQYYPYVKRTQSLDVIGKYFPEGMKSAGTAHDEIRYNKAKQKWEKVQRIGSVDMGSLNWFQYSVVSNFHTYSIKDYKKPTNNAERSDGLLCQHYVGSTNPFSASIDDKAWLRFESENVIVFRDTAYTDAASFKAAMQGVILYYELAEPIVTELDDDFNLDYEVWNGGTEEVISDVPTSPLKADITYGFNAIGKIKELEDKLNNGGSGGVSKDYVDGKLTELSAEVSRLSEGIALRNVGAEDTDESVEEPEIGGGGGGMTTPSGDPMHYMYEAVGAEWNGTGADIEKQGVYGDTITHKAGYWYLNELGDITTEEMRKIYIYANLDNGAKGVAKYLSGIETRTNIATWSSSWNGKIKDQEIFVYAFTVIVARMRNTEHYIDTNASFAFMGCNALQKILPTLDATSTTTFNGTFENCNNLREVRIKKAKVAIKFDKSPLISKASILYLIQNSAATSAIVITLHADAYARLAEDADIVAALAEKEFVSLASA